MTSHRDAFLNAVDTDRGLWQSIDVRVIAVHAQGAWHNLITQCYLRSMEPGQVPRLTQEVRSPTLWAEQYILPVAELPSLLAAVESGQWVTGDNTIAYRRGEFDSGPPRPYDLANSHFHNLDLRHVHPDFEWAGQVLHASGDHWSTIVQSTPESWQGLESTVRHQPYLAVYRLLDPRLKILKSWVSGKESKDPQGKFELAVARLFTLAGFQADPFTGHKRLSEGVDFLAHARRPQTCVVAECTTGGIDGAKLTKFVKRLSKIRRALGEVRVIGLLVTSTPLEDLSTSEVDRALADGLIIVPAGGLATLFEIVAAGTSVPAVLDFLSRQHMAPGQPTRTLKTKGLDLALTRRRGR